MIFKVGGFVTTVREKIFDPIVSRTLKISYFQQLYLKFVAHFWPRIQL